MDNKNLTWITVEPGETGNAPGQPQVGQRPLMVRKELQSAEELFHELSPATGSIWRIGDSIAPAKTEWLFRGQANDEKGYYWELRPTAHRGPNVFLPYLPGMAAQIETFQAIGSDLRERETMAVLEFAGVADKHGFVVPSDSHDLRDPRLRNRPRAHEDPIWNDASHFPPAYLMAMFALAQHHGVPTRLLDWTTNPLVAAYFAAMPVAKRRAPGTAPPSEECPNFSIYAVQRAASILCQDLDPGIHFLTVPTATNANLHAQGGQFSLVQPLTESNDTLPPIDEVLRAHEAEIMRKHSRFNFLFPMFVEFRVPVKEARTTVLTLKHMGVTAASVFPGLQGVADAIRESRYYQIADPCDRS